MKSIARSHVWWPGIDTDIEHCAKECSGCSENRNMPPESPIHPWEFPDRPWQRIHVDFAGPFMGCMFLIVVDTRSKWPEVFCHEEHQSRTNGRCSSHYICAQWSPGAFDIGQRTAVRFTGIPQFHASEWHTSQHVFAVSSTNKRTRGTVRTDI